MLHGNCVRALTPLSLSLLIIKSQGPVLHFADRKCSYPEIFQSTEFFHCWNSVMSPRRGHEQGKNLFPMSPLGWVNKLMSFIANQYSLHLPPSKLPNSLKTQVFSSGTSPWVGRPLSHSSLHTQKQAQYLEYGRQEIHFVDRRRRGTGNSDMATFSNFPVEVKVEWWQVGNGNYAGNVGRDRLWQSHPTDIRVDQHKCGESPARTQERASRTFPRATFEKHPLFLTGLWLS